MPRTRTATKKTTTRRRRKKALKPVFSFAGYKLRKKKDDYHVFRLEEERLGDEVKIHEHATHLLIPQSLVKSLNSPVKKKEVEVFLSEMHEDFSRKDNYKIHLKREDPQYIYFSYSLAGAPTKHFYVDAGRVNVDKGAFDDMDEYESFCSAVEHQNFSNKAYKKWKSARCDEFLTDVMSYELVEHFGSKEERERMKEAIATLRREYLGEEEGASSREKVVEDKIEEAKADRGEEVVEPIVIVSESFDDNEKPDVEDKKEVEPAIIPEPTEHAPASKVVARQADETALVQAEEHLPMVVSQGPARHVGADAFTAHPRVHVKGGVDFTYSSRELREFVDAKKELLGAQRAARSFGGVLGVLHRIMSREKAGQVENRMRSARARYEAARAGYAGRLAYEYLDERAELPLLPLPVLRTYLDLAFWYAQKQDFIGSYVFANLLTRGEKGRHTKWVNRHESRVAMRDEISGSRARISLVGVVRAALLGYMMDSPEIDDPARVVRSAEALSEIAFLPCVYTAVVDRVGVHDLSEIPEARQKKMIDSLRSIDEAREVLGCLEAYALFSPRMMEYFSRPDTVYSEVRARYEALVVHPGDTESVEDKLGGEKLTPALIEQLARLGYSVHEYADVKERMMSVLAELEDELVPTSLADVAQIRDLCEWKGTELGERALRILRVWHMDDHLAQAGIERVVLEEGETLVSALRRSVRAHPDYFETVSGRTSDEKIVSLVGEVYRQLGFSEIPQDSFALMRLGNTGDSLYISSRGSIVFASDSGREPGFLDADVFEGFVQGSEEQEIQMLLTAGEKGEFIDYVSAHRDSFMRYVDTKIEVLSDEARARYRRAVDALVSHDEAEKERGELFFGAFFERHHGDATGVSRVSTDASQKQQARV